MQFKCVVKEVHIKTTASEIYRNLFGNSEHSYWLDSSLSDDEYARYSFMGDGSGPYSHLVSQRIGERTIKSWPSGEQISYDQDIFTFLEAATRAFQLEDPPPLSFDFCGGYVGYFGYELMALTENVQGKPSVLPDVQLLFSDRFLAIDHVKQTAHLVALYQEESVSAEAWMEETEIRLDSISTVPVIQRTHICTSNAVEPYLLYNKDQYLTQISECKEEIIAGHSYEVCLTNRIRIPLKRYDSESLFEAYLMLREINPAPYACFFKSKQLSVLCSSPERFLKVDRQSQVEARPIKGTMPRDQDPIRDAENKTRLSSEKHFYSENLMIVDLLRNDLARSCEPGTISVPDLMKVESYATVHQLVSTIQGKLQSSVLQCIARCFPGGSMVGAPKKRTLEIITKIENVPRGIYSGAIGYISLNGTADLNIAIRTVVVDGHEAEIGVGGAITYLSDPQQEYDEMILKSLAPFSAIEWLI